MNSAHTLGRWVADRARVHGDAIAIDDRGVRVSYRHLHERSAALGARLTDAGYGPGDRIATLSGNSADQVVAFFACAIAGIAFVPLSWRATPRELVDTASRATPALLLVEEDYLAAADGLTGTVGAAPAVAVLGTTGVEASVPPRAASLGPAPTPREARDDDPLLVVFTSGSESRPKGVVLTHANCFWNNLALGSAIPLTADDVVLAILPQFHVAAWNCQPLLAWWHGATVVMERSFQPQRVLQLIRRHRVTAMMGVPTQYRMLADDPHFAETDLSSLRAVLVGGATLPSGLAERWATRGVHLVQGYGLTEAGPNVACALGAAAVPGSIGLPYPGVDVRIVDPASGLPVADAAVGELQVTGPSVFAEYLGDPAATARAMDGAWLRTGDLARREADGTLRIVDRLKDIFISGGENVAPAEVEDALALHPLIAEVAVVGVPDAVWGERGFAFVVTRGPLGVDELLAHARSVLAGFKVPVHVAFVDELPRTSIDKLSRSRLREHAVRLIQAQGSRTEDDDVRTGR